MVDRTTVGKQYNMLATCQTRVVASILSCSLSNLVNKIVSMISKLVGSRFGIDFSFGRFPGNFTAVSLRFYDFPSPLLK